LKDIGFLWDVRGGCRDGTPESAARLVSPKKARSDMGKWYTQLRKLQEYLNGSSDWKPPIHRSPLERWVNRQREKRRLDVLDQEQVDALDGLGFAWDGNKRREKSLPEKLQIHHPTRYDWRITATCAVFVYCNVFICQCVPQTVKE
jgi:Helicase associated domain